MHVFNTLGPVFLIITVGALLARFRFLDESATRVLNGCCYWIGLPCLLALKIGTATGAEAAARGATEILLSGTVVLLIIALLTGWGLSLQPTACATFAHVVFRGNLAYVGLPVITFAFADTAHNNAAGAVAAVALGFMVVLYNIIAVLIHLISLHRMNAQALRRIALKIGTNPLLLGCLMGFAWQYGAHARGIMLPVALSRTLTLLGQCALPLALLCIGSTLVMTPVRKIASTALIASLLKTVLAPLIGIVMAWIFQAGTLETAVACMLLTTPTAVASYVLTDQLEGDTALAAGTIVISTLFSAISLSVVVSLLLYFCYGKTC